MKRRTPLTGDQWLLVYMMTLIFALGMTGLFVIARSNSTLAVTVIPLVTLLATLFGNLAAKPSFPTNLIATGTTGEAGEKGAPGAPGAPGKTGTPGEASKADAAIVAVKDAIDDAAPA